MTEQKRSPVRVIMYHHTHWDREWWSTFQQMRYRLAHVVDGLLDYLEADEHFTSFTLDGQTIVLDDYLEARPKNRERLVDLVRAGRIQVGPWHVLPDEFLVSGEATIRNLWLGERTARKYGVRNSSVGYLPDQFGHIAQMPQVLKGFGIDSAVVWRGFGAPPVGQAEGDGDIGDPTQMQYPRARNARQFPDHTQSEFWWEAPDGTRVLGVYLPLEYYRGHYRVDEADPAFTYDNTVGRALRFVDYLRSYATTSFILEPMGGDHLAVDARLPGLLADLNRALAEHEVYYKLGSLEEYVEAVQAEGVEPQVVWPGEGRAFGRKAHILPGVLSARLYLKRRNYECQTALERYAEPFQALAWMLGGAYENDLLWLAWAKLVETHPHDSICGCSVDQVHREMLTRFSESQQLAEMLATAGEEDIAARVDDALVPERGQGIVVFNPLAWSRSDIVRATLNPHLGVDPATWQLRGPKGEEVPFQTRPSRLELTQTPAYPWLGGGDGAPASAEADACTIVEFVARDLPPLGYRAYALSRREQRVPLERVRNHTVAGVVARDKGAAETSGLVVGPGSLENEHLHVAVSELDGSLRVLDKASGEVYEGLNCFEDGGDAGDSYNYSWPLGDQRLSTRDVRPRLEWVEVGPARATLRITWAWALPKGLNDDRNSRSREYVPFSLHSEVTLYPGVRRVDVRTICDNTARDHRLCALFPLGATVSHSSAESQFCVVDRPVGVPEGERGSAEPAVHEHPQATFVSVSAGRRGLTIANRGLPEFSVLDDGTGTLALTVLRAVGWLSRDDILARVGGAGPTIPTPEAQMLGTWEAEYSIIPHQGTWEEAGSLRPSHDFAVPLRATTLLPQSYSWRPNPPRPLRDLPAEGSLLSVEGDLVLSALKKAEDRDALIVRLINESSRPATARLRPVIAATRAYLTDLRELDGEDGVLPVSEDGSVMVEAAPWKIVTLALEFQ